MKFSLLFILGLCALSANATTFEFLHQYDTYDGTSDKIIERIENIIKKITERFDGIIKQIDHIIQWIDNQIELMVKRAHEKAEGVKVKIVEKLDEVKRKGGEAAKCAGDLEGLYVQVEHDFVTDIRNCAESVYVASEGMKKNVKLITADLWKEIKNFREIVKDCLNWNPLGALKCVRNKAAEFKKSLANIFSALSGSVKVAEVKAIQLMNSAHECDMKAFMKAKNRIDILNEKLAQCAKIQFF